MRRRIRALTLALTAIVAGGVAGDAFAVIGRPLTPMSYAGVARRTARRTTYAYAATRPYAYGAYPAAVAAPTSTYVTSVPSTCTTVIRDGVSYRDCGGTQYKPYFDSGTVVYHAEP